MNLQQFVISFLNEFCTKASWPMPTYNVIANKNGFLCILKLKDVAATGEGASKKIAKQMAALGMWKKILKIPVISAILSQSDASPVILTGSKGALFGEIHLLSPKQRNKLRELLVLVANNIKGEPLPIAEPIPIPKKAPASLGSYELPYPDADPVVKTLETLKCKAGKLSEKSHKFQVPPLRHIKPKPSTIPKRAPVSLGSNGSLIELPYPDEEAAEKIVSENYGHTRRDRDRGPSSNAVRLLTSHHDYFQKYPKELKEAAFKVINSKDFRTKKEQAVALMAALQLTYTMSPVPCKNPKKPLVQVELHCDYNGLFMDYESDIYDYIVDFFGDMLD